MTAQKPPTTPLLEHTIGMLHQVSKGLPADGGIPPIVVTEGPRGVNVMQFAAPGNDDDSADTAYAVTANIAVLRATEVVFVADAWLANPSQAGESGPGTEVVMILHASEGGHQMLFADILRRDDQPPVFGDWTMTPVDETQGLGTFGEAVRLGLGLAADLGRPQQAEARQLVDEILDSDGTKAAMRVMLAIWRRTR